MSERNISSSTESVSSDERATIVKKAVEMMGKLKENLAQKVDELATESEVNEMILKGVKPPSELKEGDAQEIHKKLYESQSNPEYESEISRSYFADWDTVRLNGNPEIKSHVRIALLEAEQQNASIYWNKANLLGISVDEYKAFLQAKAEAMVNQSHFFIASDPEVLSRVLRLDGRWKTQFETHRSGGTMSPVLRSGAELLMFGFNIAELPPTFEKISEIPLRNMPDSVFLKNQEFRPVYGYMSDHEHGYVSQTGNTDKPCVLRSYGKIHIRLRREAVLSRATITFHDSLKPSSDWPPSPASKPHFASFNLLSISPRVFEEHIRSSQNDWGSDYVEVQYHGQLKAEDIESVHISPITKLNPYDLGVVKKIVGEYNEAHRTQQIQLMEY